MLSCTPNQRTYLTNLPNRLLVGISTGVPGRDIACTTRALGELDCFGPLSDVPPWAIVHGVDWIGVPLPAKVMQIASGAEDFECVLLEDGAVHCWSWSVTAEPAAGALDASSPPAAVNLGLYQPEFGEGADASNEQ